MDKSKLNSWASLISGLVIAVGPVLLPAVQGAATTNPYVSMALMVAGILWNHFSTPVHKS